MSEIPRTEEDRDPSFGPLMRSLAIEAVIYVPLMVVYFILLRWLAREPLFQLYNDMPVAYAIAGTVLIILQGVLLEALTSWLLRRIGLRH